MHPDKAPGPDGFNLGFYQKFWNVLGDDLFLDGVSWLRLGVFPAGLNNTVISLCSKV